MPPDLNIDLYERIAQALRHISYYKTLLALSATCHSIRTLCLKELFHSISLLPRACDTEGTKGYSSDDDIPARYLQMRLADIEQLVEGRPSTAAYVRELNIQSHKSNFGDEGFLQLLAKFTSLSAFSLSTFYVPSDEIIWGTSPSIKPFRCFAQYWKGLPKSLEDAFVGIMLLPTIRTVEIQYFQDIPVSLFCSCRDIASLRLMYSSVAEPPIPVTEVAESAHHVRVAALEFGLGPGSIAPLLQVKCKDGFPLVDTSALFSLSIHLDEEKEELSELLYNLRGIKHLYIDSKEYSYSNVPALFSRVHPDFFHSMESFRLHLTWRTSMWPERMTLPTDIYAVLSGFTVLTYLELCIVVQTAGQSADLMSDMARLDDLLATGAQFATLRRVFIGVYFDLYKAAIRGHTTVDRRKWQELRSTHFACLNAKSSVDLEVVVRA